MEDASVLVLNYDYTPVNICRTRRALILVLKGKAEIVEADSRTIRSSSSEFPLPSVIRLLRYVRFSCRLGYPTRRKVFLRDNYTCQYCGRRTSDLTLDHVIPRHMGGKHSWENVVTACRSCNQRKAGRTLAEAGMKLLRKPSAPPPPLYLLLNSLSEKKPIWRKYIPQKEDFWKISG